ncbi:MAG: RNB domain-containing ribonuclease [Deltaproteobacteria bacterium]|nr:RNB domain-containing ribonuclease [Deltaproteobacteria bacterium]
MVTGGLVLVEIDERLVLGRVTALRPQWWRVEVVEPPRGETVRIDRTQVRAVLSCRSEDGQGARRRLQEARDRLGDGLETAWSLGEPLGTGELAQLLQGSDTPEHRDDLLLVAGMDCTGFAVEHGLLRRRTPEEREAACRRAKDLAKLEAEFEPAVRAVRDLHSGRRADLEPLRQLGPRLEAWLTDETDEGIQYLLRQAWGRRHIQRSDAAQLLIQAELWDGHDDPSLFAAGLLRPPPLWQGEDGSVGQSLPVLDLPLVTIDNDCPHEVDDAVAVETIGDSAELRATVAIAHPTLWFAADSAVDREALNRGSTFYHPRHTVPMLPQTLALQLASLCPGRLRPALVFSATVDAQGRLRDIQVRELLVQVRQAWSYGEVDRWLALAEPPPEVANLAAVAQRLEARRIADGAYLLYKPECEVVAVRGQPVRLRDSSQSGTARRIITELMILAGEVAATFARDRGVQLPFRHQARPKDAPLPPGLYTSASEVFSVLRCLSPAQTALQPKAHAVMGVAAYAQVTSPLRRYTDLLGHRQLTAALRGQPGLAASELTDRVAQAEAAASLRRQWQRRAERYFKLVWLAGHRAAVAATVVRSLPSGCVAFIDELSLEVPLRRRGLACGEHLALRPTDVRPADDRAEFEVG